MQEKFGLGWTETFHFLHRPTTRTWLAAVQRNWLAREPLDKGIGQAKAAIALMTMALGTHFNNARWRIGKQDPRWNWLWSLNNGGQLFLLSFRLTDGEPGPPKLESVQARLLQVFYRLCTCRLTQAWYNLGSAVQIITLLGLRR